MYIHACIVTGVASACVAAVTCVSESYIFVYECGTCTYTHICICMCVCIYTCMVNVHKCINTGVASACVAAVTCVSRLYRT
jgi:hypothetical protein